MTLLRHGYDSPSNAIRPNADQLIETESIFLDSWTSAIGQLQQIVAKRGKSVTPDSGLFECAQKCVGAGPPKRKNPALSRRAEETPKAGPGHAPSGLNSRNLVMFQLIDPPRTPVACGKR